MWVAEVMAQQTRLESMLPYYERWMARFPNMQTLAAASEQEVLTLWEGLGYYSRARNLHRAAQIVVREYGSWLPESVAGLMKLPGIGRYTAGAIASLAFGVDAAAVDGNAVRVLTRVFNLEDSVGSSALGKQVWARAEALLPEGQAADFNQALMDLGAGLCAPRNPDCAHCPLRDYCEAYALGIQEQRPVRAARQALPQRDFAAVVLERGDAVLIRQRPSEGLLANLWEFPNVEIHNPKRGKAELRREWSPEVEPRKRIQVLEHSYSHFRARLQVYRAQGVLPGEWVPVAELERYPMGKLDRQIAEGLRDALG